VRRLIAVALACASFIGIGSILPASAAGPTTRTVYVTVVDDQGHPVPGLTPADFVVKEGGKEREIFSVASASEKMRVALMVEEPLVGQNYVRVGLADFVARMCPSAEIALFMAWQRAEKLVDFTSDPNVLIDGIRNLPISQGRQSAAVPDAVFELAKQFEKAKHPRPVIVLAVIEQGQSTDDAEGILSQIAKSKAQVWSVSLSFRGVTSDSYNGRRQVFGREQVIGDGPEQSGGRRIPVLALPGFQTGLQAVADDLESQYRITYTLPDGVKSSDSISVSLKKPGLTLRAPSRVPK
jgi:Ca-activated chloride channel homolog